MVKRLNMILAVLFLSIGMAMAQTTVSGTVIAADDGEGGTTDLTDEQVEQYKQMFAMPEDISQAEVEADTGFVITGWSF
mgnify:CR=1 FL=1